MSKKADIFSFFKKSSNEKEKSSSPSVPAQTQIRASEDSAHQTKSRTLSNSNNLINDMPQIELGEQKDQCESDSESDLSDLGEEHEDELLLEMETPKKTGSNSDDHEEEQSKGSPVNEDVTEYHTAPDISRTDGILSSPIKQSLQELTDIAPENKKNSRSKKHKRTREEYLEILKQNRLLKEAQKEKEKQEREAKKEQERQQREFKKEREKQERDAKKEQEKREREAKKEQERLAKEKKLEEEKLAKEKLLEKSRISNFFKVSSNNSKAKTEVVNSALNNKVIEIDSSPISKTASFSNTPSSPAKSDFRKAFSAFYVKTGYQLPADFMLKNEDLEKSIKSIDEKLLEDPSITDTSDSIQFLKNAKQNILCKFCPVSSHITAIELLKEIEKGKKSEQELLDLLKSIPHKYIKFYENVRPPYTGTFSDKTIIPKDNPFSTSETNYDYSYDSDLDWAEGSDGEAEDLDELDDEDEEDNEEGQEDGEFDGFLDKDSNENATDGGDQSASTNQAFKKKVFLTALIPSVQLQNDATTSFDEDEQSYMNAVSMKLFFPTPIDTQTAIGNPPTQTSTGSDKENLKRKLNSEDAQEDKSSASYAINSSQKERSVSPSKEPKTKKPKSQPSIISELKDLVNILREVEGSSFTIGTLTEVAKVKTETKYSKKIIKDTIQHYAKKDSGTQKWKLINPNEFENMQKKLTSSALTTGIGSQLLSSAAEFQKGVDGIQ